MSSRENAVRAGFSAIVAAVMLAACGNAIAQPAPNAQPAGGAIVGGSASIAQTATTTTVAQTTQRAAINWQSFDVGSQQTVTVQAPNAKAITLMQVTGPDPSQVAGRIESNGQVIIVNPAGATLYQRAQVDTGGLVLSGSDTDPAKFEAGGAIKFDKPGKPNARIVTNGTITIRGAGLAALIAPAVANTGTITAKLGEADLVGAETATLSARAGTLAVVQPTGSVTQAPDGGTALVTQSGTIRTNGGTVALRARAVDGLVATLISAGGTITANTIGGKIGTIELDAVGGSITVDGTQLALGVAVGTAGGRIGILASDAVAAAGTAIVNVSGPGGGGTIAFGTTLKRAAGGPSITNASMSRTVDVESGAVLKSNATRAGDGGRVTVLSSDVTTMAGKVAAKGGPRSGDGGFVEISGNSLGMSGTVDVTAPNGQVGTILLDPKDE